MSGASDRLRRLVGLMDRGAASPRALGLLLLLTAAAYAGLAQAGFVWDDQGLVVDNRLTTDLRNLPLFFQGDLWDGAPVQQDLSGYYRPLVVLGFALDRALFDLWAPGHHLHSLLWHLLAVAMLWRLLGQLLAPGAALAGAALFALHPAQSEAVAWISARNDPMAAALGFGALVLALPEGASSRRLLLAGLLSFAALLCKETVVLLPLLLLALDLGRSGARPARRYLALAAGIAAGLGLRLGVGVAAAGMPGGEAWGLMIARAAALAGSYGAALLWPWPLSAVRTLEWLDREPPWRTGLGLLALALILVLPLALSGARRRLAWAGIAWMGLTIAPTLVAVADKGAIGDRYVYLGIAGLALWMGACFGRGAPLAVGLGLVPALLALHLRLPDWASDRVFWQAGLRDSPSPYTLVGLGTALHAEGRPAEALPLYVAALEDPQPAWEGCVPPMEAALSLGDPALGLRLGLWALERGCPRTGPHMALLATLQARTGDWEAARRSLEGAAPDPNERDLVVRAALALREGDLVAYDRLVRAGGGPPERLEAKAVALLDSSPAGDRASPDSGSLEAP